VSIEATTKLGRPLKFATPEMLQLAIDSYFHHCNEIQKPYTISGLAVYLDTTRRTLIDYEGKDAFSHTIKMAKQRIEAFAEESLWSAKNPAGPIFNLKNNFGWRDEHKVEHTGANGEPMQFVLNLGSPPMQQIPGPVKVIECEMDEDES
jgi:hypothetical protein